MTMAVVNEIAALTAEMNRDERAVLLECARGLMGVGRDSYGPMDLSRPRAWGRELFEELRDAVVYAAVIGVRAQRGHVDVPTGPAPDEVDDWDGPTIGGARVSDPHGFLDAPDPEQTGCCGAGACRGCPEGGA